MEYFHLMVISYFINVYADKSCKVHCFIHEILRQIGINRRFEEKLLSLESMSIYIEIRTTNRNDEKCVDRVDIGCVN